MSQRPAKLLKNDKINIINHHFKKTNQRLTNLSKSTVKQLDDAILKYSIDINEYYIEKDIEKKEQIKVEEKEKEDMKKEKEFYKNEAKKHMHTVECQTFILNELEAHRLKNNAKTDIIMNRWIKELKDDKIPFEQISENELKIRGINTIVNYYNKEPYTIEYILKNINSKNSIFREYVDNFIEPEVESITAQESIELERRQREEDEEFSKSKKNKKDYKALYIALKKELKKKDEELAKYKKPKTKGCVL